MKQVLTTFLILRTKHKLFKNYFLIFLTFPFFAISQQTKFQQLTSVNNEWLSQTSVDENLKIEPSLPLQEIELIQFHLQETEKLLRQKSIKHLTDAQQKQRLYLLDVLHNYCKAGKFPVNTNHANRQPYFIDDFNTYCAVGYLMQQSNADELAKEIKATQNFCYLKNIHHSKLFDWIQSSGFSFDELALIQPAYISNIYAWITEIHYNNTGNDVNEYIEIIDGLSVNGYYDSIYFYNENNILYKSLAKTSLTTLFTLIGNIRHITFSGGTDTLSDIGRIELVQTSPRLIQTQFTYNSTGINIKYAVNGNSFGLQQNFTVVESELTPANSSLNFCGRFDNATATILTATRGSSNTCIPQPVTYKDFTATTKNKTVQLNWQTLTEINNNYFEIQHSEDGRNFTTIGKVMGKQQANGADYFFIHENPAYTNHYRIKQVDFDGKFGFSTILYAEVEASSKIKILNNPAKDVLNIFVSTNNKEATLSLFTLNGKQVISQKAINGINKVPVNALQSGFYIIQLLQGNRVFRQKIIIGD